MSNANLIDAALAEGRACLTCSFQLEDVVVLHMLRQRYPEVPVLFLDTLHHFEETYAYRSELARAWQLRVVNLQSTTPIVGLWRSSVEACCARHKIEPLFAALASYDTWFTGLRREQAPTRAGLQELETFMLPNGRTIRKVSPLAHWTMNEVREYARVHGIPPLPLYARGYTSIGCEPCTTLPRDPSNPRSGRWSGEKLECGIHVQPGRLPEEPRGR